MLVPKFYLLMFPFFMVFCIGSTNEETFHHEQDYGYGVIVDAGSSGSKVKVYRWIKPWFKLSIPDIQLIHSTKIKPGVSSLAADAAGLREHVVHLVEESKNHVPAASRGRSLLAFMATAGLRLLLETRADDIIGDVRGILSDVTINPFRHSVRTTRTLAGEEEGAFQWITVNYLNGLFQNPTTQRPFGVLEMGGASTQISFTPDVAVLAGSFPLTVGGRHYSLYSHSFLGYGQDTLTRWHERRLAGESPDDDVIGNPCMLREDSRDVSLPGRPLVTFKGTGDPIKCAQQISEFIYKVPPELCSPKPCSLGPFYQPSIPADHVFYATGVYHTTLQAFGRLGGFNGRGVNTDGRIEVSPNDIYMEAQKYCRTDYQTALDETGQSPEFVSSPCITGMFIHQLLAEAYRIPNSSKSLRVDDHINGRKISWTLGALIYEAGQYMSITPDGACGSGSGHVDINIIMLPLLCVIPVLLKNKNY